MRSFILSLVIAVMSFTAMAQVPFTPLDTNYTTTSVIIPQSPLRYDTLFIGNYHTVYNPGNGQTALAKQNHDFTGIVKVTNNKYWVIVNHEVTNTKNAALGDGGGQTVFRMQRSGGKWKVVNSLYNKKFINVDFSALGGTNTNCGGATTRTGKTLTAEEFPVGSNTQLWANGNGFSDTTDYVIPEGNGSFSGKTIKHWQQLGWMTMANPATANATQKMYSMGRFSHEGGVCMKDGKTVFLTDDFVPSVFFKFVADVADDYTEGQLYAYKQDPAGNGGTWLPIERNLDSLIIARDVAVRKGASVFTRWEWVTTNKAESKLYITETGADVANFKNALLAGGSKPEYFAALDTYNGAPMDSILTDYYGRVLEFNINTNDLRVFVEGGSSTDGKTNFASPDGIAYGKIKGKEFLIINEDLIGATFGRMPAGYTTVMNEIFVLDLDIQNPTVDDLHRFAIGPVGSETTGGVLTADGSTYIVNIQHPSSSNPFPFNNSCTIAISGFSNFVEALMEAPKTETLSADAPFTMYPNPASRYVHFNMTTSVAVYDINGRMILSEQNTDKLDISSLVAGHYYLQTIDGQIQKLIVQ
jgi:uncharacterized protein